MKVFVGYFYNKKKKEEEHDRNIISANIISSWQVYLYVPLCKFYFREYLQSVAFYIYAQLERNPFEELCFQLAYGI